MYKFKSLELENFRQFRRIKIDFDDRLTVITGANGAGKTTLLNLLGRHFGWDVPLIATLKPDSKGIARYFAGDWRDAVAENVQMESNGVLTYTGGVKTNVDVPQSVDANFHVSLPNQQHVEGLFLPSHRPVYSYARVESIPLNIDAGQQLFQQYYSIMRQTYQHNARVQSPSWQLKSTLISLATFSQGGASIEKDEQSYMLFHGFQKVLREILPPKLEFEKIVVRTSEVIFKCKNNEFSLDAASGGISAIVDLSWQIYLKSTLVGEFVAIIDEPENHLHPELQRTMMPSLIHTFPQVQFIIATHNPFTVTSVEHSKVYILSFIDGKVESEHLAQYEKSGSANQVLMDVLGLSAPIPVWVEKEIQRITKKYSDAELSSENLKKMKQELSKFGIGHLFAETVEQVLAGRPNDTAN